MRTFNDCTIVRSVLKEGAAFFDSVKKSSNTSEVALIAALGKKRFLRIVGTYLNDKGKQVSFENLHVEIIDLKREINDSLAKFGPREI